MSEEVFSGAEVSLGEMLETRERRASHQEALLNKWPDASLLLATMNIPGPVKNSIVLSRVFSQMVTQIKERLANIHVFYNVAYDLKTGPEFYLLADVSPMILKEMMIDLEENFPYGRLFDLDVHYFADGLQSISRQDINLSPRQCLICHREAKECGRQRRHSVEEMQEKIAEIIDKE
ncbi:citrate lyase holo-ACP synthase [Tetragenococcus halophilus subsp. flandriensis]|uniref:citrate lyase holo-[acyl-carrier protein] synthase n=1 Tax=Tetragenococcus halophilus TaxID=51669 RepID=UPI0023E9675C|nr:citrate lyase holo-[acyl-carrier protein] synthase [Tetragenococcus halophilus]GMA07008.1 citrate lyase holo-ACP synthase [Tetragenococcus halophilus subsp. flandriensis]